MVQTNLKRDSTAYLVTRFYKRTTANRVMREQAHVSQVHARRRSTYVAQQASQTLHIGKPYGQTNELKLECPAARKLGCSAVSLRAGRQLH